MTLALLSGATAGLGLYVLLRLLLVPQPGVAVLVARIDAGRRTMRGHTLSDVQAGAQDDAGGVLGGARAQVARLSDWLEVQAAERGW